MIHGSRLEQHLTGSPADVRLAGAVTALPAALSFLIYEKQRWKPDQTDPQCVHAAT
ncbi:hypothetical protein ACWGJB_16590 [Streptomyces sp. NPDC054813]